MQRELFTAATLVAGIALFTCGSQGENSEQATEGSSDGGHALGSPLSGHVLLERRVLHQPIASKGAVLPWSTALWEGPAGSEATGGCCKPLKQQYEAHFVSSCSVAAAERIRALCLDSFPGQKSKGSIKLSPTVNIAAPRAELECPCMLSPSDYRCCLP